MVEFTHRTCQNSPESVVQHRRSQRTVTAQQEHQGSRSDSASWSPQIFPRDLPALKNSLLHHSISIFILSCFSPYIFLLCGTKEPFFLIISHQSGLASSSLKRIMRFFFSEFWGKKVRILIPAPQKTFKKSFRSLDLLPNRADYTDVKIKFIHFKCKSRSKKTN